MYNLHHPNYHFDHRDHPYRVIHHHLHNLQYRYHICQLIRFTNYQLHHSILQNHDLKNHRNHTKLITQFVSIFWAHANNFNFAQVI